MTSVAGPALSQRACIQVGREAEWHCAECAACVCLADGHMGNEAVLQIEGDVSLVNGGATARSVVAWRSRADTYG